MKIRRDDADLNYVVVGKGPDVVLIHPFPANHEFWIPVAELLSVRYRLVMPDLRGHGDSGAGEGPATMERHSADLESICEDVGLGRAVFVGISIGGYVLFEFWRQHRERIAALGLFDTRATADSTEASATRLKAAEDVEKYGTEAFIEAQTFRLMGQTTLRTRPDLVDRARAMMRKAAPKGIAAVQRGMAVRPDSTATLGTINVPTILVFGDEDTLTTAQEGAAMQNRIPRSSLQIIPRAGHYSAFEQHEDAGRILRNWLDSLPRW